MILSATESRTLSCTDWYRESLFVSHSLFLVLIGIQRWQEVSQGKSSDELVGILLEELVKASAGDTGASDYFEGQV